MADYVEHPTCRVDLTSEGHCFTCGLGPGDVARLNCELEEVRNVER